MKNLLFGALLIGMSMTSCADEGQQLLTDGTSDYTENASQSDSRSADIASMPRPFEWRMLKEISSETDNVVISPLGLEYVLSMAANGANGDTRNEIISQLFSDDSDLSDINDYYSKIAENLNKLDNTVSCVTLNSIWADDNILVNSDFSSLMKSVYNADIYHTSQEKIVEQVNKWIYTSTDGRISGIIDDPVLFIILNISYLKADWSLPFNKESIRQLTFHGSNGEVMTDFMSTFEMMDYFRNETYDVVRKYFGNEQFSFNILLPKDDISIRQCLEELETKGLPDNWERGYVALDMPKFKTNFKASLRDILKKLGIKSAFDTSADFSAISSSSLVISDVKQNNIIEVTEKGLDIVSTNAAEFLMRTPDHNFDTPLELTADHPFIYYITENKNDVILYYGILSAL